MATAGVTFIFDPLCGWCYGAMPALEQLIESGREVELLPLAGEARLINDDFAGLIWETDRLVAQRTGQPFTPSYYKLLHSRTAQLNSWPASLGIAAVVRTRPQRRLDALNALHVARYVSGRDTGDSEVVETILREIGLRGAADLLASSHPALIEAGRVAVNRGRALLQEHGLDDAPALLMHEADAVRLLTAKELMHMAMAGRAAGIPQEVFAARAPA